MKITFDDFKKLLIPGLEITNPMERGISDGALLDEFCQKLELVCRDYQASSDPTKPKPGHLLSTVNFINKIRETYGPVINLKSDSNPSRIALDQYIINAVLPLLRTPVNAEFTAAFLGRFVKLTNFRTPVVPDSETKLALEEFVSWIKNKDRDDIKDSAIPLINLMKQFILLDGYMGDLRLDTFIRRHKEAVTGFVQDNQATFGRYPGSTTVDTFKVHASQFEYEARRRRNRTELSTIPGGREAVRQGLTTFKPAPPTAAVPLLPGVPAAGAGEGVSRLAGSTAAPTTRGYLPPMPPARLMPVAPRTPLPATVVADLVVEGLPARGALTPETPDSPLLFNCCGLSF